jgi:hypothetical protein
MGLGLCKTDHINCLITLSVITLSGFHCTVLKKDIDTWKLLSQQIHIGLICKTLKKHFYR